MELSGTQDARSQDTQKEIPAEYAGIAETVDKLLHPTIVQAVEQALMQGMREIRQDVQAHTR